MKSAFSFLCSGGLDVYSGWSRPLQPPTSFDRFEESTTATIARSNSTCSHLFTHQQSRTLAKGNVWAREVRLGPFFSNLPSRRIRLAATASRLRISIHTYYQRIISMDRLCNNSKHFDASISIQGRRTHLVFSPVPYFCHLILQGLACKRNSINSMVFPFRIRG